LGSQAVEEGKPMICQYCKEDVKNPCHNRQEMQHRAASHIDRCENALKAQQGTMSGAHPRDVRSGGRH
jgi:hypothetical protein